jgi:hypothetical protein
VFVSLAFLFADQPCSLAELITYGGMKKKKKKKIKGLEVKRTSTHNTRLIYINYSLPILYSNTTLK